VCDDSFDDADARVACKNLGFGYVGRTLGNRYGAGRGQIWLDDVECVGYETDLSFCRHNGWGVHNCGHQEDVSIFCNDSTVVVYNGTRARLAGSHLHTEGRLEVYHDGVWGTVCDDGFSANDARVACRSLGFADAGWSLDNRYGPGVGRIWLDDVSCDGSESFIGNCRHQGWGHNNCMHSEDVSIACNEATDGGVRLIGSQFEGRLEVFHEGVWGTVCNDAFDDTDAKVVCKSLGYGNVGRTLHKQFGEGTGRIWLDGVQCTGSEVSIVDCKHKDWGVHDCFHYEDVSISCISTDLKSSGVNEASIAVPIVVGVIIIVAIGIIIVRRRRRAALSESQSGILGFNEPTLEVADDDMLLNA
jgi:deleted-in-malignant-brain-tumors protein 1